MSPFRFLVVLLSATAGTLATSSPAPAQYMFGGFRGPGFGPGMPYGGFTTRGWQPLPRYMFGMLPPVRAVSPVPGVNFFNPLMFSPFNPNYNPSFQSAVTYYYLLRPGYGYAPSAMSSYGGLAPGFSTGSMAGYPGTASTQYYNLARAQREASTQAKQEQWSRKAVQDQRLYEQRKDSAPSGGVLESQESPALSRAVAVTDPSKLATGESLNVILAAAVAAQAKSKGAKVDSAYLPPNLMAEVRFAGPNGSAINMLRTAGKLEFPTAFSDGPLAALRPTLNRDFAAATVPVLAGKPADLLKVAGLEVTIKKVHETLNTLVKDMDFETATDARRFVNQLDETVKVLKSPTAVALIDPNWATQGTSVADLVKHMAKYQLRFGPAAKGGEEAYLTLHHGLIAYLYALGQVSQPKTDQLPKK